MAQPLRGTQSLVGQMGWVTARPSLTLIEVAWRWLFGIPLLAVCWFEAQKILAAYPPAAAGIEGIDPQNPWVAAVQLGNATAFYQPHVLAVQLGSTVSFTRRAGWPSWPVSQRHRNCRSRICATR